MSLCCMGELGFLDEGDAMGLPSRIGDRLVDFLLDSLVDDEEAEEDEGAVDMSVDRACCVLEQVEGEGTSSPIAVAAHVNKRWSCCWFVTAE